MIPRFRHEDLERFFLTGDTSGMNVPSFRLHPLKGDRKGQWAVWVSGHWRLIFTFEGEDASEVDLDDYH